MKTDIAEEKDIEAHTLEDVKNALKVCAYSGACSKCPYKNDCDNHIADGGDQRPVDTLLLDALFYIGELEAAQSKWISAEERLPDVGKETYVLITYKNKHYPHHPGLVDACFCDRRIPENKDLFSGIELPLYVTHWMPLPEPPKEV